MVEKGKLTGLHVAMIFVIPFLIIITVNIVLAVNAVKSFPGLDVKNSYVASQEFDDQKAAQLALGWQAEVDYVDGEVVLSLKDRDDRPVSPNKIDLRIGRATTAKFDTELEMRFNGEDFVAPHSLDGGKWVVFLDLIADDGTLFRQMQEIYVK